MHRINNVDTGYVCDGCLSAVKGPTIAGKRVHVTSVDAKAIKECKKITLTEDNSPDGLPFYRLALALPLREPNTLAHTHIHAKASYANGTLRSYKLWHWHPTKRWRSCGWLGASTCSEASPWPAVREPPTMCLERAGVRPFLSGSPDAASAANEASDGRASLPQHPSAVRGSRDTVVHSQPAVVLTLRPLRRGISRY